LANSPYQAVKDLCRQEDRRHPRKGSTTDFFAAVGPPNRAGVSVETIPVGAPSLIPTLKSGQIDAAVLNSPAGRSA